MSTDGSDDGEESGAGGRDDGGNDDIRDGELPVREIERIFSLVETALRREAIDESQASQLLAVLEQLVASSSETDPALVAEFVSLLEELIVEPADIEDANVDGVLSVFERALAGVTGDPERAAEVLPIVEAAVRDPASIEPEDVERFQSSIGEAFATAADPYAGPLGQLFGPGSAPEEPAPLDEDLDLFRLARLGTGMVQRATGYSAETGVRGGTRMAYAAMNATSAAELLTETRAIVLDELRRSGVDIGAEQAEWLAAHEDELDNGRPVTAAELRERGEALLERSADIGSDEAFHPAYPSILDELSTDEGRILRLLATEGPQPCVNVRDKQYVPFTSRLVARHLSMVGGDAGCRAPERTPIYLQNLRRLGLVRVAEDPVEDLKRYQVLDAQPHVEAAMAAAKRPKTVYRSVRLTELGIDFCETCLPVTVEHDHGRRRFRDDPD
jgi:hypothetical protein